MKLHSTQRNVKTFGGSDPSNFKIAMNAKAFRVLVDSIYADKIKAPIRELACNAWDAHIMAGTTDRPFDVHLPNALMPEFYVRDYGTGMSPEMVMNLYTTMFESTKDQSNDQTGAFGIGSKTPFAYGDSFNVTTFYEGKKRVYNCFIQSDGVPGIKLIMEQDTDEHPGVMVKFGVAREDFGTFEERAREVFKRFPLQPNILGVANFQLEPVEFLVEREGFRIRKDSNNTYSYAYTRRDRTAYAVMGCIGYPMDYSNMSNVDDKTRLILGMPIDIDFNLGELDISADRERLSYDPTTQANIRERCDKVYDEIKDEIQKKFSEAKTYWDACCLLRDLRSYEMRDAMDTMIGRGQITWKDKPVTSSYLRVNWKDHQNLSIAHYGSNGSREKNTYRYRQNYHDSYEVQPSNDIVFMYDDEFGKRGVIQKVQYFIQTKSCTKLVLLRSLRTRDVKTKEYPVKDANRDVKEFRKALGNPHIHRVSDIVVPKAELDKLTRGTVTRTKCWELSMSKGYAENPYRYSTQNENSFWEPTAFPSDEQIDEGGYYMHVKGRRALYNENEVGRFHKIVSFAKLVGIIPDDTKVYGFQASTVAELKDRDEWVNVYDYIRDELAKKVNDEDFITFKQMQVRWNNFCNHRRHHVFTLVSCLDAVCENWNVNVPTIMDFTTMYHETKEAAGKSTLDYERLSNFAKVVGIEVPTVDANDNTLIDLTDKIFSRYPMLELVSSNRSGSMDYVETIRDYILMIEQNN